MASPLPELKPTYAGSCEATGAGWRVFCGDAKDVLAALPANRYASVITSPPYYWQRDYKVAGQLGVEKTIDAYVSRLVETMEEVRRVLHPRGVLFLNLGDTYYSGKGKPQGHDKKHPGRRFSRLRAVDTSGLGVPKKTIIGIPWRVALAMIDRKWILRSPIIWQRKYPVPESNAQDRPWRTYEHVFMFTKSRTYEFDRSVLARSKVEDIWEIPSQSQAEREHPAVFPQELVGRCLALVRNRGPVLDPYVGSGTVLRVATEQGVDADGIDLSPKFCGLAAKACQG